MSTPNNDLFTLPVLTPWKKSRFLTMAKRVLQAQQRMQTTDGKTILHYTLKGENIHKRMEHYPFDDRIDSKTGAQYYYHCHRENYESEEHGHFHCFLRYKFIPKHIKPIPLPDWDKHIANPMTHLVAIGINRFGQPIRLFAVNRWISSEICYDARHTPNFIQRFKMTKQDDPYWQILDQWVEAMLYLFSPQIAWLNRQRDLKIQEYIAKNPEIYPYNYEPIEELAEIKIDLNQHIQWIIN
jgi:hypothetical protein